MHFALQLRSHLRQPLHKLLLILGANTENRDITPRSVPTGQIVLHHVRPAKKAVTPTTRSEIIAIHITVSPPYNTAYMPEDGAVLTFGNIGKKIVPCLIDRFDNIGSNTAIHRVRLDQCHPDTRSGPERTCNHSYCKHGEHRPAHNFIFFDKLETESARSFLHTKRPKPVKNVLSSTSQRTLLPNNRHAPQQT